MSRFARLTSTGIVLLVLAAAVVLGTVLTAIEGRNFFSTGNLRDILTATSILGFIAIGQTLVILCGSLDLSVPFVASLTGVIAAGIMAGQPGNVLPALLVALAVAAAIGLVNGVLVSLLHVHGFIATLGTGLVISGYIATKYQGNHGSAPLSFRNIGISFIGPLPVSTLIMLGCAAWRSSCCGVPGWATTSTPSAATPRSRGSRASARRCPSSPPTCSARSSPRSPACFFSPGSRSATRRSAARGSTT